MPEHTLQIRMLGGFSISCAGNIIDNSSNRSKKVWTILAYLVNFRKREVPQLELIELLWPDGVIESPANALKTLLYRVRAALSDLKVINGKKLIRSRRGSYFWNNDFPVIIDTEEFESLKTKAGLETDNAAKLAYQQKALELYRGDFLPNAEGVWAVPISAKFHSDYIDMVYDTITMLKEKSRYEEIAQICRKAVVIDPYDEYLHQALIRTLIKLGAQQEALLHYDYVNNLFFSQFGVTPSDELQLLYREINKTYNGVEHDLNIVKGNLREDTIKPGPFFCEYEVFKDIYRLEVRVSARTGQVAYISLISLTGPDGLALELKELNTSMERLKKTILSSLRQGDVFARYSVSQYLLMLQSASLEKSRIIISRIISNYKRAYPKSKTVIHFMVSPLDTAI